MFTRQELLEDPGYWFEGAQNELYRQVTDYMENEGINQTQLAERLNVSKGYISQILNGNFNYTLKKLIEISLAIGVIPNIDYKSIEQVIREDRQKREYFDSGNDICVPIHIQKSLNPIVKTSYSEPYNPYRTEILKTA